MVVLPLPFVPTMTTSEEGGRVKDISLIARFTPFESSEGYSKETLLRENHE